ncbi:hypothetical protein ESCOCK398M_20580 [Escherichia coli]
MKLDQQYLKDLLIAFEKTRGPVDWPPESPDNQYHLNK